MAKLSNTTMVVLKTTQALVVTFLTIALASGTMDDAYAHHVMDEIPVSSGPLKMSVAEDLLFVSNLGAPTVSIIDTTTDKLVGNIVTNTGVVAVEGIPSKNKVYVAAFESGGIDVYALDSKKFLKTIVLPESEITFWTGPEYGWVDPPVTFLTGGVSIDYNPGNEMLYVANYNANYIAIIDTELDTFVESIPTSAHPYTVKADPLTNTLLVANLAGNEVTFISTETNKITGTVKTGAGPWGLDIDSLEHLAYITHRGAYHITVVGIVDQKIVARIPVGDVTQAIAVDPDEHMIYASYMFQDKIVKIDGRTNEVIHVIEAGAVPWDLVAEPKSHKIYASMKGNDSVVVMGPKSIALSLPAVTLETPTAVLGSIKVHSQDVHVSDPLVDIPNKRIVMLVSTEDGGKLLLKIPRAILDSQENGNDSSFVQVFIEY